MVKINDFAKAQIDAIKEKCEVIKPLVVIQCIAYNHEHYINDSLDGFVMQKTDFPFVAIVHDDASSDKTAEIIKEYAQKFPNIIQPIFELENQYSKKGAGVVPIMDCACKVTGAKYIAMCEGDDYWTDPLKLQKQVDFLESHPDYGMCYTKIISFSQTKNKFNKNWGGPNITFDKLIVENTIPTLTTLIRTSFYLDFFKEVNEISKEWRMSDYPLWLYIAYHSKICILDDITGVYRILYSSASHPTNHIKRLEFTRSSVKLRIDLLNHFNLQNHSYFEVLSFYEKYLNMRIAILKQEHIESAIKSFRNKYLTTNLTIKQRIKTLKWFICPKLLSKIANFRFLKKHN